MSEIQILRIVLADMNVSGGLKHQVPDILTISHISNVSDTTHAQLTTAIVIFNLLVILFMQFARIINCFHMIAKH